jgi:radical SAM superfamily enzyme YgiQ (UPF0313 family)
MKILLFSPDNGVTRNFMPHLWMFLLQALTPPGHEVLLIDGNARAMSREDLVKFVREQGVGLVGIGAMTRMVAKAYRVADALRAAGVPVVMGGPHVSAMPGEALGRNGAPRHADAVAVGEADETWPRIVADAEAGRLEEIYEPPTDPDGHRKKPSLQPYPVIPWDSLEIDQFSLSPAWLRPYLMRWFGWGTLHVIPIETGRGCPFGCEFCTVTGFFGESIRFRTNESVVAELLRLKARARKDKGQMSVFFIDDNFAIKVSRAKALLREIIAADAGLPWVGQISANLLRDEELLDLIAASGGKYIFIGMESIDPVNLSGVNKAFSRPEDYASVIERLAQRDIYAITSFIFGMDNDTPGVAGRTLEQIHRWPGALPVFGQLTPLPGTPLYEQLETTGRLVRPTHWMDFIPYEMAHQPLKMTSAEVRQEITEAWTTSYSPEGNARAINLLHHKPVRERIIQFVSRLFFRSIYFSQLTRWDWFRVVLQNRRILRELTRDVMAARRAARLRRQKAAVSAPPEQTPASAAADGLRMERPSSAAPDASAFTVRSRPANAEMKNFKESPPSLSP